MKALRTIQVQPELPERLSGLLEIAYNFWWTWQPEAIQLLRRLDPKLWEITEHNPVLMLGAIQQERLQQLVGDAGFLAQLDRLVEQLHTYRAEPTWYSRTHGQAAVPKVAYFSAEYGLSECLPIYSGGLGILAGDHLKSASELGIPLVAVGLLYQKGYFRQYLNNDGWQQETYPDNDFYNLPIQVLRDDDGKPLRITIDFPGRPVTARVWIVHVGRVWLILLDTNVVENSEGDRAITAELYGGDKVRRIQQEIVLGIGGVRALAAMGWSGLVTHLNEGHSAFSTLERARIYRRDRELPIDQSLELVCKSTVFTTHTPVPAGIDEFPESLMKEYFETYARDMGMAWARFMALGRLREAEKNHVFNMACLALNLSHRANGVSRLHGDVSRRMWSYGWPDIPAREIPISSITNGIHTRSWISAGMSGLFDRYLGPDWVNQPADQTVWKNIDAIPDEELWRTHERRRERVVTFTRRRLLRQIERRGAPDQEIQTAREVLNPAALTIGFARRFATYKRATLLLHDQARLTRILTASDRPVQIIFAGKAHPKDYEGKELIRQIIHFARQPAVRRHVVFLENYDMILARSLIQGVDLWLNTPRRPMEACGTSGMKSVFNGGLNASIPDGWWAEAYAHGRGWEIGTGEDYKDWRLQDEVESSILYGLLEDEIVPLFYQRGADGLPRAWIGRMKESMRELCPMFNANRMIREYTETFYLPAIRDCERFMHDRDALVAYCHWKEKIRKHWNEVAIVRVESTTGQRVTVGRPITVTAAVDLGTLTPEDVLVQLYIGLLDAQDEFVDASTIPLGDPQHAGDGRWVFSGTITRGRSGRYGYSVRVIPSHEAMTHPLELRLVRWPSEQLAQLD